MYRLRELARTDLKVVNGWRNDPELISMLGAPFRFITLAVDEKWYDNYLTSRHNTVRCAIVKTEQEEEILGLISLTSIDHINQSAEMHLMIGDKDNRGKGMGLFAVNAMLVHAFCNLNLQRVEVTVLAKNRFAQRLYEKAGFVLEGRKRKARFKNGKFEDVLIYSVLREEFHPEVQKET